MKNKLLGGILLIIGTSIGGGMLALPIATAQFGFLTSIGAFFICWAIMTFCSLLILEVNLWHPVNSNLITMAKTTLGWVGQFVAWIVYLLLLYALLAAYAAGGGDFLQHFLTGFNVSLNNKFSALLFTGLLSIIVYKGIQSVDYVNRCLMFSKIVAYSLLVICIFPFISPNKLMTFAEFNHFPMIISSITVIVTSFGFAIIVPSLRSYFNNDAKKIRKAILIGSLVPLICYILWELAIMGIIPAQGKISLMAMVNSSHSTSDLLASLNQLLHKPIINFLAKLFMAISLATSFLGVALSLFDFLRDGLSLGKTLSSKLILYTVTFLPPLIIAIQYPNAFIKALSYAGILCVLLLILLPIMMAWSGRYNKKCAIGYQVIGGKYLLCILFVLALLFIILSLIY